MGSSEPAASLPPDQRAAFLQDCLWVAGLAPSPSCCPSSFPPPGFSGPPPTPQGTPGWPPSTDLSAPTPAALTASAGPWQIPYWPAEPTAGITYSPLTETCFSLSGGRIALEGCAFSSPASVLHGKTLSGLGVLDPPAMYCGGDEPPKEGETAEEKKKKEKKQAIRDLTDKMRDPSQEVREKAMKDIEEAAKSDHDTVIEVIDEVIKEEEGKGDTRDVDLLYELPRLKERIGDRTTVVKALDDLLDPHDGNKVVGSERFLGEDSIISNQNENKKLVNDLKAARIELKKLWDTYWETLTKSGREAVDDAIKKIDAAVEDYESDEMKQKIAKGEDRTEDYQKIKDALKAAKEARSMAR